MPPQLSLQLQDQTVLHVVIGPFHSTSPSALRLSSMVPSARSSASRPSLLIWRWKLSALSM